MGVAVVKVSKENMQNVLSLAGMIGSVDSIKFPRFYLDPCEVRIFTSLVPEGEYEAQLVVERETTDKEVIVKLKLAVISHENVAAVAA